MSQNSEIIKNIFSEALDISANSKVDVFFEYAAHVESITIRVYLNGWDYHKDQDFYGEAKASDTQGLKELLEYVKSLKDEI